MIDFTALTTAERRVLPGGRLDGPTPYIIALMMFVMVVIAAAGLALANTSRLLASGLEHRYSVQVPSGSGGSDRLSGLLRSTPGVTAVRPVSDSEMRATLKRWLGEGSEAADLPLPAIIDLDLAPDASAPAIAGRVAHAAPGASLVAHSDSLDPALRALTALGWLALALVLLIGIATCSAVILATRGALDTNRSTIEVMHGVGATDQQIARLFQRKMALDALVGGTAGAVAAGIVLLLVTAAGSTWLADLVGGETLGPLDILLLALLPIGGTLLAAILARRAVVKALRAEM